MNRRALGIIAGFTAVVSLVIMAAVLFTGSEYEKFEIEGDFESGEERVYEECTCYGGLVVMDSYPPQYVCNGVNMCSDMNYTRER